MALTVNDESMEAGMMKDQCMTGEPMTYWRRTHMFMTHRCMAADMVTDSRMVAVTVQGWCMAAGNMKQLRSTVDTINH